MGGKSSSEFNREYQQLIDQFDILQQNANDGLRYLQEKETKQQYLLREVSCHDKEAFLRIQQVYGNKKVQLDNNRHVCALIKIITNSQDQFCMTFFKIYALFEFPQRTLNDQINERALQKRRFQQKQLWSILASCILGLSHLQKNNIKHASLRSETILISPDGVIKIYDPIATGCASNYDTILAQRDTPHVYLSPEQVEGLKEEKISIEYEPYKTDIWTLGMIILEAGLLNYQDECFRDQYSRIHWETLQYNINLFQQTYSPQLTNLLEFMLGKDERSRPDWFELEQHVIKIEEDGRGSIIGQKKTNTQQMIEKPAEKRLLEINKPLSQSHSPSEIDFSNSKVSNSKVGITRLKQKHSFTPMVVQINNPLPIQAGSPVIVSNITNSRPLRSIFPVNSYVNQSKIDENLVLVQDEDHQFELDQQIYSGQHLEDTSYSRNSHLSSSLHNVPAPVNYQVAQPMSLQSHNFAAPRPYQPQYFNLSQSSKAPFQPQPQNIPTQTPHRKNTEGQMVSEQYKQGSRYEGYKLNGLKHGFGKFYYQDGGRYEGHWKEGKMEGLGKLYYQSDRMAYDGEWHKDQFSGKGSLYNQFPQILTSGFDYRNFDEIQQFWVKYEGDFVEDMKHGWGKLHLSNGQYFEGQFKSDYADGKGTFVTKQGNKIRGRWHGNVMQ